jgi:hypothetical protein
MDPLEALPEGMLDTITNLEGLPEERARGKLAMEHVHCYLSSS